MHSHHHAHPVDPEIARAHAAAIWRFENVELLTVGVDIGSSTSHVLFARLHLHRSSESLSGRFTVVARDVVYKSPIILTPYQPEGPIDVETLRQFIDRCYVDAGLGCGDVDTGAVILTGAALERSNADAVAELFATETGRFVCASAGHNLEAILAAHGSGAVTRSQDLDGPLLHVDIGGGTTKMCLVRSGRVEQTATVNVGGRLIALDIDGRVVRTEPAAQAAASWLGIDLQPGQVLPEAEQRRLSEQLIDVLVETARGSTLSNRARQLLLTPPLSIKRDDPPVAVTFSGGVAEYVYGRESIPYGDLGPSLAAALDRRRHRLPPTMDATVEGIRATVIGASQFTVQLSGNTLFITDPAVLPLRNLPVANARLPDGDTNEHQVTAKICSAFGRIDIAEGERQAALALSWNGPLTYPNLRAIALGVTAAMPRSIRVGALLVIALDTDLAHALGALLADEMDVAADLVVVDGLDLLELDFIDIGQPIQPSNVVPVVIKSLAFHSPAASPASRGPGPSAP